MQFAAQPSSLASAASSTGGGEERAVDAEREALSQAWAKEFGLPLAQARSELGMQHATKPLIRKAVLAAGSDLAQIGLEHTPGLGIGAYVVTDEAAERVREVLSRSPIPAKVVKVDGPSLDDLGHLTEQRGPEWVKAHPEIVGIDRDGKAGRIILDIDADEERAKSIADEVAKTLEGSNVEIDYQLTAGTVGVLNRGGYDTDSSCTLGFAVRPASGSGAWGMTSAAHCGNYMKWRNFSGGSWQPMNHQDERLNLVADIQWMTLTTATPGGKYFGSSTSTPISVTATLDRSDMYGDLVCHRGMRTGWSCGTVTSITYQPTFAGACGGPPCEDEWPKVTGPNLRCFGGDSGGPFANVGTAYGIFSSADTVGTAAGDCRHVVFSPARKVGLMGMEIVTQ